MTRTSHCALHLCARVEHMNNTNAHTTIHNPYGIAGLRSSTIFTSTVDRPWLTMTMVGPLMLVRWMTAANKSLQAGHSRVNEHPLSSPPKSSSWSSAGSPQYAPPPKYHRSQRFGRSETLSPSPGHHPSNAEATAWCNLPGHESFRFPPWKCQ